MLIESSCYGILALRPWWLMIEWPFRHRDVCIQLSIGVGFSANRSEGMQGEEMILPQFVPGRYAEGVVSQEMS